MRIALTGAEHAPGRQILAELLRQDVEAVALLPRGVDDIPEAAERRVVDLQSAAALRDALAGATHVVHASALTEPGHSAGAYEAANVATTTALLDACTHLPLSGFVLVSTTETYGWELPPWPVTEGWAAHPVGALQHSRAMAEQAAQTYRRSVPLAVLRAAPCLAPQEGLLRRVVGHFVSHPRGGLVGGGRTAISMNRRRRPRARRLGDAVRFRAVPEPHLPRHQRPHHLARVGRGGVPPARRRAAVLDGALRAGPGARCGLARQLGPARATRR